MTMMKRRNIIMVMMTSLLLGSCSSEDILSVPNGNGRIRFDVGVSQSEEVMETPINTSPLTCGNDTLYAHSAALRSIELHNDVTSRTRGKEVNTSSFYNEFGLYGYVYDKDQTWSGFGSTLAPTISNEKITNGSPWTSSAYLPGNTKKMAFFAYAPYTTDGIDVTDGTGAPKLTYTINSNVSEQKDLLVAKSVDVEGNASSVALDFKHALTAVKFSVGTITGFTKITKIVISGVKKSGTLSLDGDNWKLNESTASYTIEKDIDLSTSGDITGSSNDLMLLMPQILPSGAKLEVTMTNDIGTQTFSTDLNGEWKKGYTVTYLLSVDRVAGEFHFEVTPSTTSIPKEGGDFELKVKSYYQISENSTQVPIPWSGKYKIGNNEYTLSGDGSVNDDIRKISVPANNSALSHKALLQFINYSDSNEPHDLSMFNGKQSTANCYVVQGCGWFKLPLVYGNGITDGVVARKGDDAAHNTFGYDQSTNFMNHKGDPIYNLTNAPYIHGNGYDPTVAEVVWQSISGLITIPDNPINDGYLKFYVDPSMVDQANAVIAVKSGETIVWSWHLWFTASSWTATYPYGDYNFMTMPLGFIDSSSSGTATPKILPFTLAQNITKGKTETVMVSQNGVSSSGGTCTFYQWGRKEPFPGATENNQETDNIPSETYYYSSILNPSKFIIGSSSSPYNYNWFNGEFHDLWNIGNSSLEDTTSISKKTIYDPSPVGFKVPPPAAFSDIELTTGNWQSISGQEGIKVPTTGDCWRAFGYLPSTSGSSLYVGERGFYWSCGPMPNSSSNRYGCAMDFTSINVLSQTRHFLAHGLSVRPVSE